MRAGRRADRRACWTSASPGIRVGAAGREPGAEAGRRRSTSRARRDVVGVAGEFFVGDNTDAFGGALGLDARSAGGWAELQLFPSDRVSLTSGVGLDDIRDARDIVLPRRRNRTVFGNVIFSFTPEIQASFEYRSFARCAGGRRPEEPSLRLGA